MRLWLKAEKLILLILVPRNSIWNILEDRKVNNKLVQIIKSLYKETNNYLMRNNLKSEIGELSLLLFITLIDGIIKRPHKRQKSCSLAIERYIP